MTIDVLEPRRVPPAAPAPASADARVKTSGLRDGMIGYMLAHEQVIITQSPSYLRKAKDPETGLALLAIDPVRQS